MYLFWVCYFFLWRLVSMHTEAIHIWRQWIIFCLVLLSLTFTRLSVRAGMNIYSVNICTCLCMCVRVCVHACVGVCVCVCARACGMLCSLLNHNLMCTCLNYFLSLQLKNHQIIVIKWNHFRIHVCLINASSV